MYKALSVGALLCVSTLLVAGCRDRYYGVPTPADVQASNINIHPHSDFESSFISPGHAGRVRVKTTIETVAEALEPCKLRIDEAQTISQVQDEYHPESVPSERTMRKCTLYLNELSGSSVRSITQSMANVADDGNPADAQSAAIFAVMIFDPQRVDCQKVDMAGNHVVDSIKSSDLQLIFTVEAEAKVTADSLRDTAGSCSE